MTIRAFQKTVLAYYKKHGRHALPWRTTRDPYAILVSEIMLQQTQVDRVVPYFLRWMEQFPTVQALAEAPLSDVLKAWSGLGYNRRGKLLRECARAIVEEQGGKIPKDLAALTALPAIGPYTAGAIRAFAFNQSGAVIETNIRAAFIHHFFPDTVLVHDRMVLPYIEEAARGQDARTWNAALMDYGSYIKRTHPNPSRRSSHHTKQKKFEGSLRQARGAILRKLLDGPISDVALRNINTEAAYYIEMALRDLEKEGLILRKGRKWVLADT